VPHRPGPHALGRRFSRVLGCALAAVSACLAVPGAALADSGSLTTDANGSPLVVAAQLSPGHVLERCIVVTTPTAFASADLGMYVTADGDLANHLNVTVETGNGGGFADCTGFSGRLTYVGTLAALASGFSPTAPQRVGHYSATVSSVTLRLRFSVQDDNAAQGLTTTAAFWWLPITAAPTPAPTTPAPLPSAASSSEPSPPSSQPSPTPDAAKTSATRHVPPPTAVPTSAEPAPTTTRPPTPTALRTTPAPAATALAPPVGVPFTGGNSPTPGALVPPVSGGAGGGGSAGDDTPSGILNQLATGLSTGVANVAHTVSTAAAPALRGAAYTSLLILPLALLFLLVQRWIDRRDPKLALAPSYGDPFLGFADRHRLNERPNEHQGDAP
jgi:hypothetical protein